MPECDGCGGHVSPAWARAQSDNQGVVHACPECETLGGLVSGAAAGLPYRLGGEEVRR